MAHQATEPNAVPHQNMTLPKDPSTIHFSTDWSINLVGLNNIMARHCPQHGCTCGVPSNEANASLTQRDVVSLPFTEHPLFFLRKSTIIAAAIGIILSTISMGGYHGPDDPFGFTIFLLIISILYCLVDLISYARQKVRDPDSEPKWPSKRLVFGDFVLAGLLFILFWACIAFLTSWYYGETRLLEAYGALAALICSFLHCAAFWKELMARKRLGWLAALTIEPCGRCGYTEIDVSVSQQPSRPIRTSRAPTRPNVVPYAGPSADFREANVLTPQASESAMEEGLLIGSDFEGGYQTISKDEEPASQQAENVVVVKGKAKGKKKVVKAEDTTPASTRGDENDQAGK